MGTRHSTNTSSIAPCGSRSLKYKCPQSGPHPRSPCPLPGKPLGLSRKLPKFSQIKRWHLRMKLYVGNLSFETTETELKELFTQSGLVETVRIVTNRDTGRSEGSALWRCRR